GGARRSHRLERRRGKPLRGTSIEIALEREDVALEPGEQVEAGTQAGVRQLWQVEVEVDHAGHDNPRSQVDSVVRRAPGRNRSYSSAIVDLHSSIGLVAVAARGKRCQQLSAKRERWSVWQGRRCHAGDRIGALLFLLGEQSN